MASSNIPKTVPSLCQQSANVFIANLKCTENPGKMIAELQDLPAVLVASILEEMSHHRSLRRCVYQVAEQCIRNSGKSTTLPSLLKNYCEVLNGIVLEKNSPRLVNHIKGTMRLGMYLCDVGWFRQSSEVFNIALRLISHLEDERLRKGFELDCTLKLLRSQGTTSQFSEADTTYEALLQQEDGVTSKDCCLLIHMALANHQYNARRFDDSRYRLMRATTLIDKLTQRRFKIEALQLAALFNLQRERFDDAKWFARRAICKARLRYGHLDRRYGDTLCTYVICLITARAFVAAIPILRELADIMTKQYGSFNPHAAVIQASLAYSYHHSSQPEAALAYIQKAITLVKEIMPEHLETLRSLNKIKSMITK